MSLSLKAQNSGFDIKFNKIIASNYKYKTTYPGLPQNENETKDNSLDMDITGYIGITEKGAIRFKFRFNSLKYTSYYKTYYVWPPTSDWYEYNYNTKRTDIIFGPGYVSNFKIDKLNIMIGTELPIKIIGKEKDVNERTYYDSWTGTTNEDKDTWDYPSGFGIGLGVITGINCIVFSPFSFGIELTAGYEYLDRSGKVKHVEYYNWAQTSDVNDDIKEVGFQMIPFNISLALGCRF